LLNDYLRRGNPSNSIILHAKLLPDPIPLFLI